MSDDGGLTGFLNAQTDGDGDDKTFTVKGTTYTLVQTANPVNWGRIGAAIVLSGIATVSVGLQELTISWFRGIEDVVNFLPSLLGDVRYTSLLPAPQQEDLSFVELMENPGRWTGSGLIGELFLPLLQWMVKAYRQDLWQGSIDSFGVFGYPVAVGFTLLILYIVVRGLQMAGSRLAGGQ